MMARVRGAVQQQLQAVDDAIEAGLNENQNDQLDNDGDDDNNNGEELNQGFLGGMPTIPSRSASNQQNNVNVPPEIMANGGGGGGSSGGSSGGGSASSVTGLTISTASSSHIPEIPAYHRLGNAGAGGLRSSKSEDHHVVSIDKRAHDKYAKKFVRAIPLNANDVEEVEILIPKDARGIPGSKEYLLNQKMATESLEHQFGVPSHLVTDKGVAEDGDQVKHLYIQQQYVGNLAKIDQAKIHILKYDMLDVAMCPVGVRNPKALQLADIFEFDDVHILEGYDTISWQTACTYQWAVNVGMSKDDQTSSKWLKSFLYESCTTEMKEVVMLEYQDLPACFRGGVTFAWILCHKLFGLNRDVTAALIGFLKHFRTTGIRRYQGENVALAKKELLAVCSRLCEAKVLPQETPVDLLTGLSICSVDSFKTLFEHKLQQSKVDALEGDRYLTQPEIMAEVRGILSRAVSYYSSLSTSSMWLLPQKKQQANVFGTPSGTTNFCWNCGKQGHGLDQCREPRNEDKIAENRRKWSEAGGKSSRKKKSKSSGGAKSGGNYEREKWSPPKPGESGVRHIDGVYHAYCGKKHNGIECGWNKSHSTGFHRQWAANSTTFNLADVSPTHELVLKTKSSSSSSGGSSGGAAASVVNTWRVPDSIKSKILLLNDGVRTPNEQVLMDSVLRELSLN